MVRNSFVNSRAAFGVVVAGSLATGANASDFTGYHSTTPLLYIYAACALDSEEATAEAQIAKCAPVKSRVEALAGDVIERFHVRARHRVEREFRDGIEEIERDARLSREQRKAVPNPILKYIECLGESVLETDKFREGLAISYFGIEEDCSNKELGGERQISSEAELQRIRVLYRRFARFGEYKVDQDNSLRNKYTRSAGAIARGSSQGFNRSFLDLATLEADDE